MLIKLKIHFPLRPGTNRIWITKAYTKILIKAQVSLGSQPQYRPQLSLAHIPPKKFPMVSMINPTIRESSLIMVNSLIFKSILSLFFFTGNGNQNKCNHTNNHTKCKRAIAAHYNSHVDHQPITIQNGL